MSKLILGHFVMITVMTILHYFCDTNRLSGDNRLGCVICNTIDKSCILPCLCTSQAQNEVCKCVWLFKLEMI